MNIRRPRLHFSPETGWINDPNGCIFYQGKYHVFFQHNADKNVQEEIGWGHAVSEDLVKFEQMEEAILPDRSYDRIGCWSGSSIEKDGKLYLIYTSFGFDEEGNAQQTISVAFSDDGIRFEKYEGNPVIRNEDKPSGVSKEDFRDPFIYRDGDGFSALIGTKSAEGEAMILVYETSDLLSYRYKGKLVQSRKHGTMFECPSLTRFEDRDLLVFSPQNKAKSGYDFDNISSSVYQIAPREAEFIELDDVRELDHGGEFYAPLLFSGLSKVYLIAWNQMWGRNYLHRDLGASWCGNLTLPREISIEGGRVRQIPVPSVDRYWNREKRETIAVRRKPYSILRGETCFRMRLTYEVIKDLVFTLILKSEDDEKVFMTFDYVSKTITFDRSELKIALGGLEDNLVREGIRKCALTEKSEEEVDLIFDEHVLELFFNGYTDAMTNLVFMKSVELILETDFPLKARLDIRVLESEEKENGN